MHQMTEFNYGYWGVCVRHTVITIRFACALWSVTVRKYMHCAREYPVMGNSSCGRPGAYVSPTIATEQIVTCR